ncbi:hypothetical protein Bbad01_28500 [Bacillus badius]|nr:hypothetical protein Bbad01_28500 [Bacillus badius]
MVYHSKPDVFSILSIFLLIWIMGVVSLVPFITSFAIGIIMFAIFVISAIFIWWYTVSIQYVRCSKT